MQHFKLGNVSSGSILCNYKSSTGFLSLSLSLSEPKFTYFSVWLLTLQVMISALEQAIGKINFICVKNDCATFVSENEKLVFFLINRGRSKRHFEISND